MPVGMGQLLIATVTVIVGVGFVFEAGRRIGQNSEKKESNEADLSQLEELMDSQFEKIEARLDYEAETREREHGVVIEWLGNLTDALKEEGYDVERPEQVKEDIDISPPQRRGDGGNDRWSDD